ncbi:MAG: pyruvate, water dikinase regulatory protein [Pseudomonadota bacterium]|nr:kinase/pyrophosphorylase [Gammaproteobacteria bacterium]MBU1558210.1 kinase/pyrophosphorylase [Gammaproteobacteria bacterium]MBU1628865.1 kinase/pyrophosphorylase [Gammaproteobacteria bacterium]MBU1926243.1 kinase/pyrophosphorylase [Gammaproteobacteria bacterium]MBU2546272.1 kinase/pyrophosphorylase [Gammaproteobacteria bacterium]
MKKILFFISDSTGLTIETLGNSLLTQFNYMDAERITLPYINTVEKAHQAAQTIQWYCKNDCKNVLIFSSLVDPEIRKIIRNTKAIMLDSFETFLPQLEQALQEKHKKNIGLSHAVKDENTYASRIEAINFALLTDDGGGTKHYDQAEIILTGISRSGKTPTCLYLALQFGVLAANYPITEEDLHTYTLPKPLQPYQSKLFGLTIQEDRLQEIRAQRRPDSRYASSKQCQVECQQAEDLFKQHYITYLNTTRFSIEEIATHIIHQRGMKRKRF